jgi:N-acetylglucosamine-6-phosphate deacetylase
VQLLARHFQTSQLVRIDIDRGRIAGVSQCDGAGASATDYPWVAPLLIDIQVNGYEGHSFTSGNLTPQKVGEITRKLSCFGVGRYLPTLCTASYDGLSSGLRTIVEACRDSSAVARRIAGVHVEGPYISREDGPRGAHPQKHCRPPDWDEFQRLQEAAEGQIRILTLSPEYEGAPRFIRQVADTGVIVAIAHTAASSDQIRAAVDAGATLSTHLGNATHAMIHRHHNYIWDQLAEDRLMASLIGDGHHLPPPVLKTFVRAKTPGRCILVSDMAIEAGLPPGRYDQGLCEVDMLPNGRLVVAGQTELMAGATEPIGTGVANVVRFAGVSLCEAIAMATDQPAELLGLRPPRLEPGEPADVMLFDLDDRLNIRATVARGEVVFGTV